jgi:hypothetical protein
MFFLGNEHRPLVDINVAGPEPLPELLRLGKEVVSDQLAFEQGKGRDEAVAIAKVERHSGACVVPEACASPTAMRARSTEGRAVTSYQFHAVLRMGARQCFWVHVLATEDAALTFVTGEHDALVSVWSLTGTGIRVLGVLPCAQGRYRSGACEDQ